GNLRAMVCALYCPDTRNGPGQALPFLEHLLDEAQRLLAPLPPITSAAALEACLKGSRAPGRLMLLENADALADLEELGALPHWGIRAVGLTHAGRNRLACGNAVPHPEGLSAEGRRVVRALSDLPLALDVAHLAEPGFFELLEMDSAPLISSHTGLRAFCDTPRNLSGEQLRLLLERGGVIGLSVAPEMLSSSATACFDDFITQLDWLVQRYGAKGIALGSDFGGFDGLNRGMESCGSYAAVAEALLARGYPVAAVAAIMGGNWARLYGSLLDQVD
ncbi:MAG: peptidase M19, partial [Desulfuromonadales bacterium]|nr:peptidase M19 [Desulfuromonadales bacterium]NIS40987.1 peptidase M19 [Desulfuromonadales bacterium]